MGGLALRVENVTKLYRIGVKERRHETLAGAAMDVLRRPAANLRALRRLTRFATSDATSDDVILALRDISFEVGAGEVLGVIGSNGAGKSTLLKILSGITDPSAGRAEIYGRVASLLEVGTGFHPDLTGRENVYLNGTILGMKKMEIDRKFDEIVAFSGVEKFIDTPVKRYSSGMKVRLGFAVAAHLEPEVLLVDEVLAVGDAAFQKKCLGKMGDVARSGRTVLFVSHNMAAVSTLCHRTLQLEDGRLARDGATAEVVNEYLSSVAEEAGVVRWPDAGTAPGNEVVRILGLRCYSNDLRQPPFPMDQPLTLEVDYLNLQEGARMYVAFQLKDPTGAFVFATMNFPESSLNEDPYCCAPLARGLYRTACTIPADTLNNLRFTLNVRLVGPPPPKVIAQVDDGLAFTMLDRGTMRPPGFPMRWPGSVRLRLAWRSEGPLAGEGDQANGA